MGYRRLGFLSIDLRRHHMKNKHRTGRRSATISQQSLASLWALRRQIANRQHKANLVRQEILDAYDAGAAVEPGPFDLQVEERARQWPTWPALKAALSKKMVKFLRKAIPLTITRIVRIEGGADRMDEDWFGDEQDY